MLKDPRPTAAEVESDLLNDVHEFGNALADCVDSPPFLNALHDLVYRKDTLDAAERLKKAAGPILDRYIRSKIDAVRGPSLMAQITKDTEQVRDMMMKLPGIRAKGF